MKRQQGKGQTLKDQMQRHHSLHPVEEVLLGKQMRIQRTEKVKELVLNKIVAR